MSTKPGGFKFNKLNITSHNGFQLDLVNLWSIVELYEDIYSSSVSMRIQMLDTGNNIRALPIIGQEDVEIEFDLLSDGSFYAPISLSMKIVKISDLSKEGQNQTFVLELVTKDFMQNFDTRISEYFEGPASQIAAQVYGQLGSSKNLMIRTSDDQHELIVPNFTPLKALDWLAGRAYQADNASYLFFENNREYVFAPFPVLIEAQEKNKFLVDAKFNTGEDQNAEDKKTIYFRWHSTFDNIKNITSGFYNATVFSHDIVGREMKEIVHSFWDNFSDYKTITGKPFQDVSGTGYQYKPEVQFYVPENSLGVGSGDATGGLFQEEIFMRRKFHMQLFNNLKCEIGIFADPKLGAGDTIELNFNSNFDEKDEKLHSGKWLISAIKHEIDRGKNDYRMRLECVRDSVGVDYPQPIPILKQEKA